MDGLWAVDCCADWVARWEGEWIRNEREEVEKRRRSLGGEDKRK